MVNKKVTLVQIQRNCRNESLRHTPDRGEQESDGALREGEKITYLIDGPFNLALLVAGAMHVQEYLVENNGKKNVSEEPRVGSQLSLYRSTCCQDVFSCGNVNRIQRKVRPGKRPRGGSYKTERLTRDFLLSKRATEWSIDIVRNPAELTCSDPFS